jgi:fumarylacetoacetase
MLLGFGALASGVVARRPDGAVVDLSHLGPLYQHPDLMAVLAAGPSEWDRMRDAVDDAPEIATASRPLVPIHPGDYVDCYACEYHAANVGRRFRPGQPPLPAAWRHIPIGYHGRTSTIVVSGDTVYRPSGVRAGDPPTFGPSLKLDVEVELGFVVGIGNERGRPVRARDAEPRLFGVVVLNDWSARDIQSFESVPLGPFVGKSFCTSLSPWVVPMDLVPRISIAGTGVELAPYLIEDKLCGLDVDLTLEVDGVVVSETNARHLSWTPGQMLAQVTVGGASTRPGDLIGSGTISGPSPGTEGSLLELDVDFLEDGQRVTIASELIGSVEGRIEPCLTTVP